MLRLDPAKTQKVVADLISGAGRAGSDASVKLAPNKKSFVVVPAVKGKSFEAASFQDVVAAAGHGLKSAETTVQFVDSVPAVTTAEAQRVADRANALVARTVKVSDGDDRPHRVEEDQGVVGHHPPRRGHARRRPPWMPRR